MSNQCYGQPGLSPSRDSGKLRTHTSELSHPWGLSESEIHPEKEVRGRLSASDISQIQLRLDLAMPEGRSVSHKPINHLFSPISL